MMTYDMRESKERSIQAYSRPLEAVTSFKYFGRILTASDNNWLELVGNLSKAQNIWDHLSWILGRKGEIPRVLGIFLKAFVQAVLLWGKRCW